MPTSFPGVAHFRITCLTDCTSTNTNTFDPYQYLCSMSAEQLVAVCSQLSVTGLIGHPGGPGNHLPGAVSTYAVCRLPVDLRSRRRFLSCLRSCAGSDQFHNGSKHWNVRIQIRAQGQCSGATVTWCAKLAALNPPDDYES